MMSPAAVVAAAGEYAPALHAPYARIHYPVADVVGYHAVGGAQYLARFGMNNLVHAVAAQYTVAKAFNYLVAVHYGLYLHALGRFTAQGEAVVLAHYNVLRNVNKSPGQIA